VHDRGGKRNAVQKSDASLGENCHIGCRIPVTKYTEFTELSDFLSLTISDALRTAITEWIERNAPERLEGNGPGGAAR
jgi:hypothetical protein